MKITRGTCLPDCHIHTRFSSDCDADPRACIEQAIALGMPLICFTDHHDMDFPDGEFQLDVPAYQQQMASLAAEYASRIEVLCGVELGLLPYLGKERRIERFAEAGQFDYVIGSIHIIDGKDPYYRQDFEETDEELYRLYFEQTLESIQENSGFQALGHLDYIVRYGYEKDRFYSYEKYRDVLDEILSCLISRDIALEVNTAGFRKGLGFPNPHPDILWRYRDLGGEKVTIGSDAHMPQHVGADFKAAAELLQALGFRYLTLFHGKEESRIPLDMT